MRAIPTLKISISGVRGVVGDSLTPTLLVRFAQAFGTYVGSGTVVIGRDTRPSGEMVNQAVPDRAGARASPPAAGRHRIPCKPQPCGVERAQVHRLGRALPRPRPRARAA